MCMSICFRKLATRSMRTLLKLALALLTVLPMHGYSEALYEQFPTRIIPSEKYVFYSHGLIVEGEDPTPVHPEFGEYQFPAIVDALFDLGGFNLIAHHRPANTEVDTYVETFSGWVQSLLDAGVPAKNITLIGFSRGSHLTALTSDRFRTQPINTVLMAGCFNDDMKFDPPIQLGGRLLSLYETSDVAGSCKNLAARSEIVSFDEVAITTGKKHGAFYTPVDEWIVPIRDWLQ